MRENTKILVQRAQRGDVEAFGELVGSFQDAVFGAACAMVQNFHDAEEIAQEAFVLAYQELPRLREPEKFPGWLRRITMTACNRFLRSRKISHQDLSTVIDIPSNLPRPDVAVETNELKEQILREIGALSEKNRMVTTLYLVNGYSYKEISDFLEVRVPTIKSRLHESRKKLQGRLINMVAEVLKDNKPGAEFIRQLKEKLNGKIIELPDGRVQVFYDFVDEKQLEDWRIEKPYKAAPEVKDGGLAFGRVEPEETDKQWERHISLSLVFDPDPRTDLEIEYDVIMGTCEPWCDVVCALATRGAIGRFFHAGLTNYSDDWRENRDEDGAFRDGYIRADFLRRFDGDEGSYEEMRWVVPTQSVPIAESYHMRVTRHDRKLRWEVNDQTIGEANLADDELCLTERLILTNHGKGTGAVYRNVVIRGCILDIKPAWSTANSK